MEKRLRFGDLVRGSGRPQTMTLWTNPKKDRSFSQAVQHNRVLTVVRKPTAKQKDFGTIGFHEQPYASYLVFPRPLPKEPGARVVGINYQLLEEPAVTEPYQLSPAKAKRPSAKPKPTERAFTLRVRRTATVENNVAVQALSREAAEQKALEAAKELPFEVDRARIRQEVA